MLLQNGIDELKVWDLKKGSLGKQGRRLHKKGAKTVDRPFTSCVPIGRRTILVEAWSNEWRDKRLGMCLRADIGSG